jgi:hypothetical protein
LSCVLERSCSPCWARTRNDRDDPPGSEARRIRCLNLNRPGFELTPEVGRSRCSRSGSVFQPVRHRAESLKPELDAQTVYAMHAVVAHPGADL